MLVLAAGLGLVVGLVIGALGGGGGVLTVPLLVYALGLTAQSATTSSIVIVGSTALLGTLVRIRGSLVDRRTGLTFGVLGVPATYLGTQLNHRVDQQVLLLAFAAVTILAAVAMLLDTGSSDAEPATPSDDAATPGPKQPAGTSPSGAPTAAATLVRTDRRRQIATAVKVVLSGLAVGFVTGFLGVGGGFLVVPALVIVLRMPMSRAVGTSLLIITLNAVSSMASRLGAPLHLDWRIVLPFTVLAVVGSLAGKRVADRLAGQVLSQAFAVMLILVGGGVAAHSLTTL